MEAEALTAELSIREISVDLRGERAVNNLDREVHMNLSELCRPLASPRRDVVATGSSWAHDESVKLKLDLHEIYNRGDEIERALRSIIDEAVAKKAPLVEIIPGKGSGQLKKRVLRFLDQEGGEGAVSPSREGLGQLRSRLRPFSLEVAH